MKSDQILSLGWVAEGRKIKFQDDSGEGRNGNPISVCLKHTILEPWEANDDFCEIFTFFVVFRADGNVIQALMRAVGLLLCQELVFGELQFPRLPLNAASPHPGLPCLQGMGQGMGMTLGLCWAAVSRTEVSFSPPSSISPICGGVPSLQLSTNEGKVKHHPPLLLVRLSCAVAAGRKSKERDFCGAEEAVSSFHPGE